MSCIIWIQEILENVQSSWDSPKIMGYVLQIPQLNQGSIEYWTFYKKNKVLARLKVFAVKYCKCGEDGLWWNQ